MNLTLEQRIERIERKLFAKKRANRRRLRKTTSDAEILKKHFRVSPKTK